jgi:hypothetical protein
MPGLPVRGGPGSGCLAQPQGGCSFVAEQGSYFSGENVTFHRRADGRVISVLLVASTFMRLDQVPRMPGSRRIAS